MKRRGFVLGGSAFILAACSSGGGQALSVSPRGVTPRHPFQKGFLQFQILVLEDDGTPMAQALKQAQTADAYSRAADPYYIIWREHRWKGAKKKLPSYVGRVNVRVYFWNMPDFNPDNVALWDARGRRTVSVLHNADFPAPEAPSESGLGKVQAVLDFTVSGGEGGFQLDWENINPENSYLLICFAPSRDMVLVAPSSCDLPTAGIHIRPADFQKATAGKWAVMAVPTMVAPALACSS